MTEKFIKMLKEYSDNEWFQDMPIYDNVRLDNDWNADSLDRAILIMEIEKNYNIEFNNKDFYNEDGSFKTLKELNDYIEDKVKNKK